MDFGNIVILCRKIGIQLIFQLRVLLLGTELQFMCEGEQYYLGSQNELCVPSLESLILWMVVLRLP